MRGGECGQTQVYLKKPALTHPFPLAPRPPRNKDTAALHTRRYDLASLFSICSLGKGRPKCTDSRRAVGPPAFGIGKRAWLGLTRVARLDSQPADWFGLILTVDLRVQTDAAAEAAVSSRRRPSIRSLSFTQFPALRCRTQDFP